MGTAHKARLSTYQTFGLRKDWLLEFLRYPEDWVSRNGLGNRQFEAVYLWLRHAELISKQAGRGPVTVTDLTDRLARRGVDDVVTWAAIWANLARNSSLVRWYLTTVPWGVTITKEDLVSRMREQYPDSERTRANAVSALIDLLVKTPLGDGLGLGERTQPSKRGGPLYKRGWPEPSPSAVLYSLYRLAERTGRYELTVGQIYHGADEGPYMLFGVPRQALEGILKGMSARSDGLIRVDIVRDLDNVFVNPRYKSVDVLDYAHLEA